MKVVVTYQQLNSKDPIGMIVGKLMQEFQLDLSSGDQYEQQD